MTCCWFALRRCFIVCLAARSRLGRLLTPMSAGCRRGLGQRFSGSPASDRDGCLAGRAGLDYDACRGNEWMSRYQGMETHACEMGARDRGGRIGRAGGGDGVFKLCAAAHHAAGGARPGASGGKEARSTRRRSTGSAAQDQSAAWRRMGFTLREPIAGKPVECFIEQNVVVSGSGQLVAAVAVRVPASPTRGSRR